MTTSGIWFLYLCIGLAAACFLAAFAFGFAALVAGRDLLDPKRWRRSAINTAVWGAVILIVGVVLYPVFAQVRQTRRTRCLSSIKQLAMALATYAEDNDRSLPHAATWSDASWANLRVPRDPRSVRCDRTNSPFTYAFNANMSRVKLDSISNPARSILLFEVDAIGPNAYGGPDSEAPSRHARGNFYGFPNSAVRWIKSEARSEYRWKP